MDLCGACNEGKLIEEEGGIVCPLCGYYEEEIQLDSTTIAPRGGNIYEPSKFIKTTKGHRLPGQMIADTRFDIHLVRPHLPLIRSGATHRSFDRTAQDQRLIPLRARSDYTTRREHTHCSSMPCVPVNSVGVTPRSRSLASALGLPCSKPGTQKCSGQSRYARLLLYPYARTV
jgi:hypothetical protein